MDNNTLKLVFVAVMIALTFWTKNGFNSVSEAPNRVSANEDILVPVKATVIENIPVPAADTQKNGTLQSRALVQKPHFYPQTNFSERNKAMSELIADRASAVLISDIDGGEDIFSLNAGQAWPIASLTKLMTSLVAIEQYGVKKEITVSQSAVDTLGEAGNFTAGERYSVLDMLKSLLLVSSNDAAVAMSEAEANGQFIRLMNEKAKEIKLGTDTRFVDPTGLDPRNQSTLTDLKKLISYIYKNQPQILRISREDEDKIKNLEKGVYRKLLSINEFGGQSDFLGGKTGYIEESGGNLISLFSRSGHPILIIVFGSSDRFGVTRDLLSWFKDNYAITPGN